MLLKDYIAEYWEKFKEFLPLLRENHYYQAVTLSIFLILFDVIFLIVGIKKSVVGIAYLNEREKGRGWFCLRAAEILLIPILGSDILVWVTVLVKQLGML